MAKNKKLIIGLVVFAFCLCCAIFGLGFTSKNSIVAKADTIAEVATMSASAAEVKSIGIASNNSTEYNTVAEVYVEDESEDIYTEEDWGEEDDLDVTEYGLPTLSPFPTLVKFITLSGYVNWKDDNGNAHPLRQVQIRITDYGTYDYVTYTDDYGYYYLARSFMIYNKIDIIAYAIDNDENIKITNKDDELYNCVLRRDISISSSTVITLEDLEVDMTTEEGQAFQISQAIITARDFAQEMMGKMPSPVAVRYPSGESGCSYNRGSKLIKITNTSRTSSSFPYAYASWDVIMHEYGHHIQYEMDIIDSPNGDHVSSRNDADELENKDKGVRLAWAESWPTVFGIVAQKYYVEKGLLDNIKTVGDSRYTAYKGLNYDLNENNTRKGEACEQSIMAVLWDLFDFDFEENDTIYLGYQGFWDITTKDQCKTFSEFIEVFYDTYPDLIDAIGANLSYYNMASSKLTVTAKSFTDLPKFSWEGGGGSEKGFNNNYFDLVFYNEYGTEVLKKSGLTSASYTLSRDEAHQVFSLGGNIYWTVKAENRYDNTHTGPYIAQKQKVEQSFGLFTIGLNRHMQVTSNYPYCFKFIAPSSGTYTFYTEGGSDTYGEVCNQMFDSEEDLLACDDNSGDGYNFKITLYLEKDQCVYIRVSTKVFFNYYNIRVKQE